MTIKPDYISKVDPSKAQSIVDDWSTGCWEAIELTFGKDKVFVFVHGKGPAAHIQYVEEKLKEI